MRIYLDYNVISNFNAYAEIIRSADIYIGGAEYHPKRTKKKYYHNSKK